MRATSLRRMLVFGVCAAGVVCLYVVPGLSRTSDLGLGPTDDDATRSPTVGTATRPVSAPTGSSRATDDPDDPDMGHASNRRTALATRSEAPAVAHDTEPPSAVPTIRFESVTSRRVSLSWSPANDNIGVIGYRVWVNGYAVATTVETHATVQWFNDGGGQHAVQVRAIDAQGNESATSPTLVVTRPSTDPTPEPTPTPTPTQVATPEPTPDPTTSTDPTASAGAGDPSPTTEEHVAANEPSASASTSATT